MTAPTGTPALGPVEFIVLGFPGNRFTGEIAPALRELLETGTVRIIDMAVIAKDADGTVTVFELQELSPEVAAAFVQLDGEVRGLLSEADLAEIAADLPPGTTAATVLFEHAWATRLAQAVRAAHGELLLAERVPPAVIAEARASLLAAAAAL